MTIWKRVAVAITAGALGLTMSACGSSETSSNELTVISHESFVLPQELKDRFANETGYTVHYVAESDAGTMASKLVLTKDNPIADVVYGLDNTVSYPVISAGALTPYKSAVLPPEATQYAIDNRDSLTPIDVGDVCVNADKAWFARNNLPIPVTLDDLTNPMYKNLLVVENPASSSPGMAFLTATVGAKGQDGYLAYWGQLKDNGVKVVKGWTEAYFTEFSGGPGKGSYPLVLSYSSSPADTVMEGGNDSSTTALLGACFRQVEYAGVLKGARNSIGARKFIDFMLSPDVQASMPVNNYMYPVLSSATIPATWKKYAPLSDNPIKVDAALIANNRQRWVTDWTSAVIG